MIWMTGLSSKTKVQPKIGYINPKKSNPKQRNPFHGVTIFKLRLQGLQFCIVAPSPFEPNWTNLDLIETWLGFLAPTRSSRNVDVSLFVSSFLCMSSSNLSSQSLKYFVLFWLKWLSYSEWPQIDLKHYFFLTPLQRRVKNNNLPLRVLFNWRQLPKGKLDL